MAIQKVSPVLREAIWIAHGKKCAYTHELVDLASLHIDHIIPESLASDPEALSQLKATLGLEEGFDVCGLENLLPCKPGPNLQKGKLALDPAGAHFFLNVAASKKAAIERNVDTINRRLQTGRAVVLVQQLLDAGRIQPSELAALLTERPEAVFKLVRKMQFADDSEVTSISKGDLADLRDRPVKLGINIDPEGIVLCTDAGEEMRVRTCTEYEAALKLGYYAPTTFAMKMSAFFEHQCGLLAALAKATLPLDSYISEPRVGLSDLRLLPVSLFPDIRPPGDRGPPEPALSYQDRVDAGALLVKRVGSAHLLVEEPAGMGQQLVEVVRADFDGDGLEDVLVFEYCYATHGTLGFGGTMILTRRSAEGVFEVVGR